MTETHQEGTTGAGLGLEPPARVSLPATVAGQLAELIVGKRLDAGSRLPPERDLARQLRVSRLVIREALKALAERGLVEVRPGVGTFVATSTDSTVTDALSLYIRRNRVSTGHLFDLRSALEPAVAAAAARCAQDDGLAALEDNLRRTEAIVARLERAETIDSPRNSGERAEASDGPLATGERSGPHGETVEAEREKRLPSYPGAAIEQFAWADLEFHQLLANATDNPLFRLVLDPLVDPQLEVRRKGARVRGAARNALAGHLIIFERVSERDPAAAAAAMKEHLAAVAAWLQPGTESEATEVRMTAAPDASASAANCSGAAAAAPSADLDSPTGTTSSAAGRLSITEEDR
jgi:DNA-binding FadR family transcriptional regulator